MELALDSPEAEVVVSEEVLVAMTMLVGTSSVELAVAVLLAMLVVVCCCVKDGVEEDCFDVVDSAGELDSDCKTLFALVHNACGPSPFKKYARIPCSLLSRRPSSEHASLTSLVIESRPFKHSTLQPC